MEEYNISTQTGEQEQQLKINQKIRSEKTEKLLTPDFVRLLHTLFFTLNEERKAVLDYRGQINKALQKDFENVIAQQQIQADDFAVSFVPSELDEIRSLIICPANQTRSLVKLINGNERYLKPGAIVLDFSYTLKPVWANVLEGVYNLMEIANESAKFSQRSFAEFSLIGKEEKSEQPQIVIKPRALHCEESNITIGDVNYPAAILDFALVSYYTFRSLTGRNKIPVITIECASQFEAQWWNELINVMEEFLRLEGESIKVIAGIDSAAGVETTEAIVYEFRNRIVALQADFKGKIFNDLKLLRKKSDRIVEERKSLGVSELSLRSFAKHITATGKKYNLHTIAGLSVNAAGQFADFKDVNIAKYEEELAELAGHGFDAFTVSHQGYIEFINEKFDAIDEAKMPKQETLNRLPVHSQKISMLGLRDNIRTAITFMHAWNQGTASAVFDNRWEDLQTFEIIRAQIYQWMRNSIHVATGERINSRMITTLILEESEKLQDEIRTEFAGNPISEIHTILNTYTQAALEVEQLFLKDELQEYFGEKLSEG